MTDRKLLDLAKFAAHTALKAGAKDARTTVSRSREVEVEWRDGKLDRIRESTRQGLSITLFVDGRYSSNATSDIRSEAVEQYVQGAVTATRYLAPDEHRHLPDPSRYEGMTTADLELKDPALSRVTPEARLTMAKQLEDAARAGDKEGKIVSVTSSVGDDETRVVCFNTNGLEAENENANVWCSASVSVKDKDDRKPSGDSYGWTRFLSELPPVDQVGSDALARALSQIGSRQIPTGVYDMVIENRAVSSFARHLMSPLSGASIQQKRSFLEGYLKKPVASKMLTITDDPHLVRGLYSNAWDEEGMATKPRKVIDRGVLKTFYLDTYYASKLDMEPTTAGSSNLIWSTGKRDAQAMIKRVKNGVFVTSFLGGNSNSTTGDFSLGIKGFFIKNGELAHPISEMNMAGNHLKFWKTLAELGNDPWKYSPSLCPTLRFKKVQCSGSKA